MHKPTLRFAFRDGPRSGATWKLWAEPRNNASDFYLASRSLGRHLKISFHESGNWHIAYSPDTFYRHVEGTTRGPANRFIRKWMRPGEYAPGHTMAAQIVTPYTAVTQRIAASGEPKISWLSEIPSGKSGSVFVVVTRPESVLSGWPGSERGRTTLIGSFQLNSGESVWAVHCVTDMPAFNTDEKYRVQFYTGRGKEDLHTNEDLRVFAIADGVKGSIGIIDARVVNNVKPVPEHPESPPVGL